MNILSNKKQVSLEALDINDHAENCINIKARASEKEQAVLTLCDNGMIRTCNQAGEELLDCSHRELAGQPITRILPELTGINLVRGKRVNPSLSYRSRIGHQFEVVNMKGTCFTGELFFNDVENLGQHHLRVIICRIE